MAKIIYFLSPFDETKRKEFTSDKKVKDILIELEIEKESLCVTLNGETPEDFDLNYPAREWDVIEIRRLVAGEGSASQKRDLALIVQIAALVAITILSAGSATPYTGTQIAILIGSTLISGALMRRAAELAAFNSGQDVSDIDINANKYSLTNATNEARPLSPMPIIMGATRFAPDFQADAFKSVYNSENIIGEIQPLQGSFYPGITSGNGVNSGASNWATMPANYCATGLPRYDIKIAPYHFLVSGDVLTPALNASIIAKVKADWLANGSPSEMDFDPAGIIGGSKPFAPLVIYHPDSSDPFYGKYDLWFFMARIFEYWGNSATEYANRHNSLFTAVGVGDNQEVFIFSAVGNIGGGTFATNKNLVRINNTLPYWYPSTLTTIEDLAFTLLPKIQTFLGVLNGGNLTPANKATSFSIENFTRVQGITSVVKEGIDYSTQVVNYGIGQLDISERKIGLYNIDANDYNLAGYSAMVRAPSPTQWMIPSITYLSTIFDFYISVLSLDRKSISNTNSPSTLVDITDQNQYNWILLEGKLGQNFFKSEVTGNIYSTTGGGISTNNCLIQLQIKKDSETDWQLPTSFGSPVSVFAIANNNTKKMNLSIFASLDVLPTERLQVRVRKVTLDSVNNENGNLCNLFIDNIRFVKDANYFLSVGAPERLLNAPQWQEGLSLTALVSDAAQTNKYSAYVESYCWVYDFDLETWSWSKNRNPAFWFLFFARGGFLNLLSDGLAPYPYPYSPTTGWVNYPDHPNSTEIIFGAGLVDEKIDMDKIIEWAQFCDDNNLFFDFVLRDDTSCSEVLERIANVGRGSVTYYNGLLSVVYENTAQVPTCLFGMANILAGSFSVNYSVSDPVGKVIGKYVSRDTWESVEVSSPVPYAATDNIKTVEVNLEGITETQQAQREVNILAARQFFQRRTYTWDVDVEGLIARRGDLVYLSHDSTQYGFSGRIKAFIVEAGVVKGVETTSVLDDSINYVTIREPDGTMNIYAALVEGNNIMFTDTYPINKASYFISNAVDNELSDFYKSIPEDFIFIAGAKETAGKLVRISEIRTKDDFNFTFVAIDEDPAMWSYEYAGVPLDPESFDDVELDLSIDNVGWKALGGGLVKLNWETVNGDFIYIVNEETGLPIQANGSYSFSGGEVILELIANQKYDLIITPFTVGTQFKTQTRKVTVWPT